MAARVVAIVALCVPVLHALQPTARIYIDTQSRTNVQGTDLGFLDNNNQDIEKRYTNELLQDYENTNNEALLLYTEYTGIAADELKMFLSNISMLTQDTINSMNTRILDRASRHCRDEFDRGLKSIEDYSHRAASFNAENHHKYFQGHMIVFTMHLERAKAYITKCQEILRGCGTYCETIPRMIRKRRCALRELNRVKDDIQHSRKSYTDLLFHSRRKLKCLRRKAELKAKAVVAAVHKCVCTTTC